MSRSGQATQSEAGSHVTSDELADLLVFAESLARRAGHRVKTAALDPSDATTKANPADWVTPVDEEVEDLIRDAITSRYPTHAIIGEERPPTGDPSRAPITWHIDPIDGTTNFVYGLGNVSISIGALDADGFALGVVHDVYRNQTIGAARGHGVRVDGVSVNAAADVTSVAGQIILTEWSGGFRPWAGMDNFVQWASDHKATLRIIGSCALALAHAGLGRAAATILPGRRNSWDVVAGIVIAREGGCQLFDSRGPTDDLPPDGLLVVNRSIADDVWNAWRAAES